MYWNEAQKGCFRWQGATADTDHCITLLYLHYVSTFDVLCGCNRHGKYNMGRGELYHQNTQGCISILILIVVSHFSIGEVFLMLIYLMITTTWLDLTPRPSYLLNVHSCSNNYEKSVQDSDWLLVIPRSHGKIRDISS